MGRRFEYCGGDGVVRSYEQGQQCQLWCDMDCPSSLLCARHILDKVSRYVDAGTPRAHMPAHAAVCLSQCGSVAYRYYRLESVKAAYGEERLLV